MTDPEIEILRPLISALAKMAFRRAAEASETPGSQAG